MINHDCAVITVVYNNYDDLHDFFASFAHQTDKSFHIFLVDLSSKSKSIKVPDFVTLVKDKNKGYGYGLNVGVEKALSQGYEKFVCMNNDTTVARDFIEKVFSSLNEHPRTLIGGKIYYSKGSEFHKDRYSKDELGRVLWYAGGAMDWANAYGTHRGVDEVDRGQYDAVEPVDFVTGCLFIFDKLLWKKAGKIDARYFMYYEDTDWNARIKKRGCPILYDPKIVIWHKNAQSTGGSGSAFHMQYQRKNRLKFALRYAPLRTKFHVLKNYLFGK